MPVDQNEILKTTQHLEGLLSRNRIAGFSTGDVWIVRFVENDFQLAFHDFSCSKEFPINQGLRKADATLFDCADPEDIGKAVVLTAATRRKILSASIDRHAALSLVIEGDIELILASDTEVVDWQWCVTKNAPNPYIEEYELACFWKGEVSRRSQT